MAISDMSQPPNSETRRSWQEIAREVTQEQDPTKVRKLSAELNQAMLDEERRKVRLRFKDSAGRGQARYDCYICNNPIDISTAKTDAAGKAVHEECYVLRELLKQNTTPTDGPRAA